MDYHFYNSILFAVGCVYDFKKNCRKFYHCGRMPSVSMNILLFIRHTEYEQQH